MATNPITSESLTVDFRSLMKVPVGDRMKAASISPDFLQSILNALTPIQIANAFPDYYKRQLPDVSNFITSNILARNGGNFNQTGGGDDGSATPYYDGEDKPDGKRPIGVPAPTIQEMKEKLLEKGINVDNTYDLITESPILEGDERIAFVKNMTNEELLKSGFQRIEDENGRTLIQKIPQSEEQLQEEMRKDEASQGKKYSDKPINERYKSEKISGLSQENQLKFAAFVSATMEGGPSHQGRVDTMLSMMNRAAQNHGGYGDMFHQLTAREQYSPISASIHGKSADPHALNVAGGRVTVDQIKAALSSEDPMTSLAKLYGRDEKAVEAANQIYKSVVDQDETYQEARKFVGGRTDYRAYQKYGSDIERKESDNAFREANAEKQASSIEEFIDTDPIITDPNKVYTPEEIAKYAEKKKEREKEALTESLFNQPSPTSSEFPALKDGETRVSVEGEKLRPVGTDYDSLKEFWSQRNPRTDINRVMEVDPDLLKSYAEAVQQYEAANPGLRVELFGPAAASRDSGSTSNHGVKADGYSKALDFAIIDRATGKQITNLGKEGYSGQVGGSEVAAREYTRLHSLARIAQEHYAPHESNLRQGGGFVQGVTADWMHGDIQSENMAAYSWEKGYDPNFRRQFNIQENLILGEEERIRELGQQIYGQVDESGYYTNRADFSQLEDGNTTVVSKKVENPEDDIIASAQPESSSEIETSPENTVFVGDSIAQGLKDAAGGEGHTIVGRKPHEVLADMENLGPEHFKGKKVVLSTGLSNNTRDIESVKKQMQFLKDAGANVQVAGMSNSREDLAPGNQQLQSLAGEYGYPFMGGFVAGEDEIHPTSYSKYAASATESMQTAEAAPAAEAPIPATQQQTEAPEPIVYDGRRELFQIPETPEVIAAAPEPIVYDGRRELFQTPEAPEAVVDEQPAISKLNKPSVIPPGTNKHQADMGNATSDGPFASAEEVSVASVETKETTAAPPPPPPEEVRKYALGGNIYEPNEDMTLVDTETGNPIAQIGNDEKIEKTGSAIQVTPETKLKAEELTNKYDSSTEMEDRMSNIEDNLQNQKTPDTTNQITQKAKEPEKNQTETPYRWRESVASAERPVSPSFNRAMARSKFFGEGHHFNRSAPGSQS
jgi:hypothetical protein